MKLVLILHILFVPLLLFGQDLNNTSSNNIEGKWVVDSIFVYMTLGHMDFPGRRDTIELDFSTDTLFIGVAYFQKGSRVNFKKDGKMIVKQRQKQIIDYKLLNNNIFLSDKVYPLTFLHSDIFVFEGDAYRCNACHFKIFIRKLSKD